ncbi:MAG: glycine cleavage system protein H [Planctomycetaceae bacterium]|nr:glycine cleavage system protein H [Planctomycetaceae bacterium]
MSTAEPVFMMGKFPARIPTDRRYARNHMWAQSVPSGYRFGFSAYAVRLLQDVYFLEWTVDEGTALRERQAIGNIESSKAESELYSPVAGTLRSINADLLRDPSSINVDTYGPGWLFEIETAGEPLLDHGAYLTHLAEAWKVAERTIKGQANED